MYVVVVWLDVFNLWNVDWCDVVRCLDVEASLVMDYFLAYAALGVLAFGCVYVVVHNFIVEEIWKGRE